MGVPRPTPRRRRSPPLGPVWRGLIYAFYAAFGAALLCVVGFGIAAIGGSLLDGFALGLGATAIGMLLVPAAAILGFFFGARAARDAYVEWLAEE